MTAVKHHILQHMPVFLFKESVRCRLSSFRFQMSPPWSIRTDQRWLATQLGSKASP